MNFFEKIIHASMIEIESPTVFSAFHISFLVAFLIATVGVSLWLYKNPSDKAVRIFTAVAWGIMVLFEIYKQINFSFIYDAETNTASWDYDWHSFPFQLCSSPLYLFPFAAFLKDGKFRDAILAYLCTFSFFGGFVVMIYPGTVFIVDALIDVQTMVHHGLQTLVGIVLTVSYRKKFNWKFFATGLIVFAVMLSIAQLLNWFVPYVIRTEDKFTMFSLSWKWGCELPVLDQVYAKAPYAVFLLCYVIGFIIIATIVFLIIKLVLLISAKRRERKKAKNA